MGSSYSIKDLEYLTGIKAHTLRIWEQRYGIVMPQRTETNIRFYSDEDLKTLLNIAVLIQKGWRISKVADLSKSDLNNQVLNLAMNDGHYPSQIARLLQATIDLDEPTFTAIMDACIHDMGEHETFTKIVGGFIHQVGVLWQTDAIGVAHEHFASNLIKQKLYTALDKLPAHMASAQNPGYLVFLADQEMHELALLYVHYILKAQGQPVVYLGQSVPLDYLEPLLNDRDRWKKVISIWTTTPDKDSRQDYWNRLEEMLDGTPFWLSGIGSQNWDGKGHQAQAIIFSDLKSMCQALHEEAIKA
ncbi:MAG: MerR family transcriptional regulator [Schleiferiaceae bacterium]|nr:MerR family transcriptional regulator [Schleiferiaceae bacterium]